VGRKLAKKYIILAENIDRFSSFVILKTNGRDVHIPANKVVSEYAWFKGFFVPFKKTNSEKKKQIRPATREEKE
jgi:hypothetical protein